MSHTVETFQIPPEAAEAYEAQFVPRLFAPWARHLVDLAAPVPGQRVLDVACGTGVVAREAEARLDGESEVVGVDLNESMLAVARRLAPGIEWRRGDVERLPFGDATFDLVLCQSALMFFPDREGALGEMARVVRPEGHVVIQVWNELEAQPAYRCLVEVAARHAGPDAIRLLGTYWSAGDLDRLTEMLREAGLDVVETRTLLETAPFASIDELVETEVRSTPLAERLSDEAYAGIVRDARVELGSFVADDGGASIPLAGHLVKARRG